MNIKFTGPCIATTRDKRNTLYLIVEESSEGKAIPQKVKCWGRGIEPAALAVKVGDMVHIEARLEARPWEPKGGGEVVWYDGLNAVFIEVLPGDTKTKQPEAEPFDDTDVPF